MDVDYLLNREMVFELGQEQTRLHVREAIEAFDGAELVDVFEEDSPIGVNGNS